MDLSGTGRLVLNDGREIEGCFNLAERGAGVHNLIFLPFNFDASLMKAEAVDFIDEEERFTTPYITISRRNYNGEITLWCACRVEPSLKPTQKQVELI